MMRINFVYFYFFISLLFCTTSFASISLSETRLYFDNSNKSNAFSIRNTITEPIKYSIQVVHQDMTEDGVLYFIDEEKVGARSAKKLLRYSPRRGIIEPQKTQAVRFTVRKPANLPTGEYRAVLKITSQVVDTSESSGIKIIPKLAYNIPIIIRHGKLTAMSTLENPQLIMQNSLPTIQLWQTLSGERSIFGDFVVKDGNDQEVGRINGVAVYVQLKRRQVNIPLSNTAQGKLTIHYNEQRDYGGNIKLMSEITID